jgi:hypothetical protein
MVFAGASPDFVTIRTEVGGRPGPAIRVLTWQDGRPDVVEVVAPDGTSRREVLDRRMFDMLSWQEASRSRDGSVRGRLGVPTALGSLDYVVESRPLGGGEVELLIHEEGAASNTLRAVMPRLEDEGDTPSPQIAGPALVILLVIICFKQQEESLQRCHSYAEDDCGKGNVNTFDFFGVCGQGSCSYSCD